MRFYDDTGASRGRGVGSRHPIPSPTPKVVHVSTVMPWLRYRNAFVAIDWLRAAFGFEPQYVQAEGHTVLHARLSCGDGAVMLGSAEDGTEWDRHMLQPDETGGRETQSCCVIVDDIDAHYTQAIDAGAEIVIPLSSQEFGFRGYACRDIEGHLWWFGSEQPWIGQPTTRSHLDLLH
jgi:uncharacterized glyoxalase superfamily protein PhnB